MPAPTGYLAPQEEEDRFGITVIDDTAVLPHGMGKEMVTKKEVDHLGVHGVPFLFSSGFSNCTKITHVNRSLMDSYLFICYASCSYTQTTH